MYYIIQLFKRGGNFLPAVRIPFALWVILEVFTIPATPCNLGKINQTLKILYSYLFKIIHALCPNIFLDSVMFHINESAILDSSRELEFNLCSERNLLQFASSY